MKKITLFAVITLFSIGCSDDDSKKETCDCRKEIATYNETLGAYEPISSSEYSNDCDDETTVYNDNGDGNYYIINCTQN